MAKDVIMPVLGMNQDTAVLLSWLKQEGEKVEQGEPIMEVETDKATMELDAPASGTLSDVRAEAGDEVKVGSVVAVILAEGEAASDGADDPTAPLRDDAGAPPPTATVPAPALAETPAPSSPRANAFTAAASRQAGSASGIVPASPKARRLAQEGGLSLEPLRGRGRGPDGAVLAADVMAAAARPTPATGAPAGNLLRFERTLAASALLSAMGWIEERLGDATDGGAPAVGDLIARFLVAAWSRQPLGAGSDAVLYYRRVCDGRVSTLALPLTEASSIATLVRTRTASAERTRADTQGSSDVALLDLSASRADLVTDSLPLTARIVDVVVGRLEERVVAEGGSPVVDRVLRLSFTFDASQVALEEAAAFSDRVVALVEEPAALALLY